MNTNPTQPDANDREALARLLPGPVERDLPSDRHRQIQEFVMAQIHQDLRSAGQAPRRSPKRRPAVLAAALTAAAAATAATLMISAGEPGGSTGDSVTPTANALSGRQILLAAATTAETRSEGSGTYWHLKLAWQTRKGVGPGHRTTETWTRRDGRQWSAVAAPGTVSEIRGPKGFLVADSWMSLGQIQKLPTDPAALRAWIAAAMKHTPGVRLPPGAKAPFAVSTLTSLLCQVPAPPEVRAAAFRALATVPNVKSLGVVQGGEALLMPGPDPEGQTKLVIDPATSLIRAYTFSSGGAGKETQVDATATVEAAEWTNRLPKVVPLPPLG